MAHKEIIALTKDTWTKVATDVQSGQVVILNNAPGSYLHDFKATGEAAPTDDSMALSFDKSGIEEIKSSFSIDVYIKARGAAGSVLVMI